MALVRMTALKDFRATSLSTTDVTTAYQLGALTTGQKLYGALHLTTGAASTARVAVFTIQSATASAFGSPSTQISFTRSTLEGAEWGTPIGGLSTEHTWFRGRWVMSTAASTAGTWKGVLEVGIR